LEKGVVEFGGSGQELVLVGDLLRDLKSAELLDRWIEVYLKVAYDHRTATLVSDFAEDAVLISKARGREHDVLQALRHVNAIPLDFEGKHRISTVLLQLRNADPR
jgi:hypothetical protein